MKLASRNVFCLRMLNDANFLCDTDGLGGPLQYSDRREGPQ